ncbi:hypothetical protein VTK73DRAFT_4930 [Phialemonium thermophilum]|uniref:Secreted protein n=1 Tax=Phialemonium thermophilum TaxID=223376 RepID=A0ABR3V4Q7_9PEZI
MRGLVAAQAVAVVGGFGSAIVHRDKLHTCQDRCTGKQDGTSGTYAREKVFRQVGQGKGFSLVWLLSWRSRCSRREKSRAQTRHLSCTAEARDEGEGRPMVTHGTRQPCSAASGVSVRSRASRRDHGNTDQQVTRGTAILEPLRFHPTMLAPVLVPMLGPAPAVTTASFERATSAHLRSTATADHSYCRTNTGIQSRGQSTSTSRPPSSSSPSPTLAPPACRFHRPGGRYTAIRRWPGCSTGQHR